MASALSVISSTAIALSLLAPTVVAHGWLANVTIDGTTYSGLAPQAPPTTKGTVIRQVSDVGPVKNATNPDIVCGLDAAPSTEHASAKPGSTIEFRWVSRSEDGKGIQNWIHKIGPAMAYLAECIGVDDCRTFDASKAAWFKFDQLGLIDSQTGVWWVEKFNNGSSLRLTLPSDLKPGNYLFRSELIALHTGTTFKGAEFYPACVQLSVDGSETGTPNGTVTFPGAYSDSDPGIFAQDIFNTPVNYIFPGGPVSNLRATDDSAKGRDLTALSSPAHSSNVTSSGGSNSTAPTASQSAESQPSADGTATTPSTESPATAATTTPADENTDTFTSPTTAGPAAAKTTCASTAALAQRKRIVDRSGSAVAAAHAHELRRAQVPRREAWHW